ncbi:MAG: late competence development ComFB family protein [Candidatus Omnitrophica bacterium]|nr:late competence development ComFB family protein [Candidatus Omnitrophota bacterium]
MKLYNYMEGAVEEILDEIISKTQGVCKCNRCRLDILALALNKLPPKYAVSDKGINYTKISLLQRQFNADITRTVTEAIKVVSASPRHNN